VGAIFGKMGAGLLPKIAVKIKNQSIFQIKVDTGLI